MHHKEDAPQPQHKETAVAKSKEYSYAQGKFIPINFDKQILPGTFKITLLT